MRSRQSILFVPLCYIIITLSFSFKIIIIIIILFCLCINIYKVHYLDKRGRKGIFMCGSKERNSFCSQKWNKCNAVQAVCEGNYIHQVILIQYSRMSNTSLFFPLPYNQNNERKLLGGTVAVVDFLVDVHLFQLSS